MKGYAILLGLTLVLAGCAGNDETTTDGSGTTSAGPGTTVDNTPSSSGSTSGGPGSSTTGQTSAGNSAPSGSLKASIKQGEAPLLVNFTLGGADPDGDDLAWTLDVDDDGTPDAQAAAPATFPVETNFTYTAAGVFNVTYRVTDGAKTAIYHVLITVTVTAPPPGPTWTPIHEERDVSLPCTQCSGVGSPASIGFNVGNDGLDATWVDLPPEAAGHAFLVDGGAADPDGEFLTECDPAAAPVGPFLGAIGNESGEVPEGAGCLVVWSFETPAATIIIDIY